MNRTLRYADAVLDRTPLLHEVRYEHSPLAEALILPATRAAQEDLMRREEIRAALARALDTLPLRERLAVSMAFGMDGAEPVSLVALADVVRVSRAATSAWHRRGLDKLRTALGERP